MACTIQRIPINLLPNLPVLMFHIICLISLHVCFSHEPFVISYEHSVSLH